MGEIIESNKKEKKKKKWVVNGANESLMSSYQDQNKG